MDISLIPPGIYCYAFIGKGNNHGSLKILKCPYHNIIEGAMEQENGYCHFLQEGDQDNGFHMLWDLVKSCDINDDVDCLEDKSEQEMRDLTIKWMENMLQKNKVSQNLLDLVQKEMSRLREIKEK